MTVSDRTLNTRGNVHLSIGVCARCDLRTAYDDLREDGNVPGLWVCQRKGCWDNLDPWKLPGPPADQISLDHARPDAPIIVSNQPTNVTWDSTAILFDDSDITWDQT